MITRCRTNATKTIVLAFALLVTACYDQDPSRDRKTPVEKPVAPPRIETRQVSFVTDIFLPNVPKDPAEQQQELDKRCKLWETYLNLGQSPAQRRGDDGRGIVQGSINCTIVGVVKDTGATDEEGNTITKDRLQGRMEVQVSLPAGRTLRQETRHRFARDSRYDAWLDCHKAAARTQAEAFLCRDNGEQDGDGKYVTNLVALHF